MTRDFMGHVCTGLLVAAAGAVVAVNADTADGPQGWAGVGLIIAGLCVLVGQLVGGILDRLNRRASHRMWPDTPGAAGYGAHPASGRGVARGAGAEGTPRR